MSTTNPGSTSTASGFDVTSDPIEMSWIERHYVEKYFRKVYKGADYPGSPSRSVEGIMASGVDLGFHKGAETAFSLSVQSMMSVYAKLSKGPGDNEASMRVLQGLIENIETKFQQFVDGECCDR